MKPHRAHRDLLIGNAEVDGRLVDIAVVDGVVTSIESAGARRGRHGAAIVLHADGAALIPGLHDHHIHVAATAAARNSLDVGPPSLATRAELATALDAADKARPAGAWLRAVGYHESVAGDLDRDTLDQLLPVRPLRVQHRSGAAWIVNSAALRELGIDDAADDPDVSGIERDRNGRATGRLFRLDSWLREQIASGVPDLETIGRELSAAGVVGFTDATPWSSAADHRRFAAAVMAIPQRVLAMAAPGVVVDEWSLAPIAATKVVLADHDLPMLDDIESWFAESHDRGLPVAVHAVTADALALSIAAWHDVGVLDGDRIEHAAMTSGPAVAVVARLGVRVVTQPGFVASRGDSYLDDVPALEHRDLWRCATLLAAGIRTAAGSDAPHGPLDPWSTIASAVDRRTQSGRVLGPDERISAERSLGLWMSRPDDPGGSQRTVAVGAAADLCLLDAPLAVVLQRPSVNPVIATIIGGDIVYAR